VLGHGEKARTGQIRVEFEPVTREGKRPLVGFHEPDEFLHFRIQVYVDSVRLVGEPPLLVSLTTDPEEAPRVAMHWPRLVWAPEINAYRSEAAHVDDNLNHLLMFSLGVPR
jgi:hypothetical protein